MTMNGEIQLIIGPMFSGKTTELIRRCKRYQIANYHCIVVKYANDDRYSAESVATHDSQTLAAIATISLASVKGIVVDYDIIAVDEGQFFPDVVPFCEELANTGKTVIVAALDGTYQRKGFPNILELVPISENVLKLNAVCMLCFRDAAYTKRKSADTELELIGGADKYMAVCRKCYNLTSPAKQGVETEVVLSKFSPTENSTAAAKELRFQDSHEINRNLDGVLMDKENCARSPLKAVN